MIELILKDSNTLYSPCGSACIKVQHDVAEIVITKDTISILIYLLYENAE